MLRKIWITALGLMVLAVFAALAAGFILLLDNFKQFIGPLILVIILLIVAYHAGSFVVQVIEYRRTYRR